MRTINYLLLAFVVCVSATAQDLNPDDFVFVLTIVPTGGRHGAAGSLWLSELLVRNDAAEPVIFGIGEPVCHTTCPTPGAGGFTQLPPETTDSVPVGPPAEIPFFGTLLYFEKRYADQIWFGMRLWEDSTNGSRPGTAVPVVREEELHRGRIQLLNIPLSDQFRIHLRTFETDRRLPEPPPRIVVRAFHRESLVWSEERTLTLLWATPFVESPAEDVLYNLELRIPPGLCCEPLRIEIEPLEPGRYWAYVAVTSKTTQEVILVTPE